MNAHSIKAEEIYNQLGGRRFSVMTGYAPMANAGALLLIKGKSAIKIELDEDDTYSISLLTGRDSVKEKKVWTKVYSGVYFDQLVPLFEDMTGLVTHI